MNRDEQSDETLHINVGTSVLFSFADHESHDVLPGQIQHSFVTDFFGFRSNAQLGLKYILFCDTLTTVTPMTGLVVEDGHMTPSSLSDPGQQLDFHQLLQIQVASTL
jgi:hypothetical protein